MIVWISCDDKSKIKFERETLVKLKFISVWLQVMKWNFCNRIYSHKSNLIIDRSINKLEWFQSKEEKGNVCNVLTEMKSNQHNINNLGK